ncbi:unnamed protein product [Penicillium salamii]|uniref:Enoyl reductase (ER) domain-containing protein n=1 Tax=Penicillium salamii TaxID=1612424 RepID=A0A9W4JIC3_9EURO|nr:unnamed protein product [Penicillium salamii]CAG8104832.1 unnamed protein product [Penicillium salamii]CAG8138969.1 unnamed protein product [Penicillium salamii]CAG8143476.1 unnamed protein product [Penicillium salamii]CAG8178699.1 unnamed protein product [Penicillium salamii]
MTSNTPSQTPGWQLVGSCHGDGASALRWSTELPLRQLGQTDVLVELHAWSLNFPDVSIADGTFPWVKNNKDTLIPGSDGAGTVIAVGSLVDRVQVDENVLPLYYPRFLAGPGPSYEQMEFSPGSASNAPGTFRKMAVFDQAHVIAMPSTLRFEEAATLPCSALTAWNALHGMRPLEAGECVLVQGTGGVSLFAVLFALAAGAIVIATTSSEEKASRLRQMGVHHVINYKINPDWGVIAKTLSPSGLGCHRVIEVGGQRTIQESFHCVARGGEIDIIGFLSGQDKDDSGLTFLEPLLRACTVRGIEVGSREQFEEMSRAIVEHNIKPVIDVRGFTLKDLPEAYRAVSNQSQFGKLVLTDII